MNPYNGFSSVRLHVWLLGQSYPPRIDSPFGLHVTYASNSPVLSSIQWYLNSPLNRTSPNNEKNKKNIIINIPTHTMYGIEWNALSRNLIITGNNVIALKGFNTLRERTASSALDSGCT